jgi:hypothetical protein
MEVRVQLYAPFATTVYASKQYDFLVASTDNTVPNKFR